MDTMKTQTQKDNRIDRSIFFRAEHDFFDVAADLREQFEKKMLSSIEENDGITPLAYVFCKDKYQFLTASGERIFTTELLERLIDRLRTWANRELGVAHVHLSTPQLRVYVAGCSRILLRDDVNASWHYALSLTRNSRGNAGSISLLKEPTPPEIASAFHIESLITSELEFNLLFVHSANDLYSIESTKKSVGLLTGTVFLDGYLW